MHSTSEFPPSREAALARLERFVPRAGAPYAEGRNTDAGPGEPTASSRLSAYLRYRLLTEREVVARVLEVHGLARTEKFVQEVAWRTYWKGWLEQRSSTWRRFLAERERARATLGDASALREAEEGRTGIEGFDDWARELVRDGHLHNHARMWFASIWIFTLRLPWTLGADFFLRHLVDADPASNTLSWRWVSGLQTRGKSYLASAENIARFTNGRFSPRGLAREAFAIEEAAAADACEPRALDRDARLLLLPGAGLASPSPSLLLVTHEDLHPESIDAPSIAVRSALVMNDPALLWGDAARAFVAGASADACSRIATHFGCEARVAAKLEARTILEAARTAGVRHVVTPYAPVGPVADAIDEAAPLLAPEGVTLARALRPWDAACWPHAQRGFFPFKERMRKTLTELGVRAR
jgi:deoxyribodipyrimidine photo-lyase